MLERLLLKNRYYPRNENRLMSKWRRIKIQISDYTEMSNIYYYMTNHKKK
jgi:hypothetical protein